MNIALIAHDEKKSEMIEFAKKHEDILKEHLLYTTGTTGLRIMENTQLKVIVFYLDLMVEINRLEHMSLRGKSILLFSLEIL